MRTHDREKDPPPRCHNIINPQPALHSHVFPRPGHPHHTARLQVVDSGGLEAAMGPSMVTINNCEWRTHAVLCVPSPIGLPAQENTGQNLSRRSKWVQDPQASCASAPHRQPSRFAPFTLSLGNCAMILHNIPCYPSCPSTSPGTVP